MNRNKLSAKPGAPRAFGGIDLKASPVAAVSKTFLELPLKHHQEEEHEEEEEEETDLSSLNSTSSHTQPFIERRGRPSNSSHPHSGSHSRLSELASKMSEFLLSTRNSIDIDHESALESPNVSRNNSSLSLNLLSKPVTKRKSFFGRNSSPSGNISHSHHDTHFASSQPPPNDVKETHHVKVEYDPVTRKRVLNTYEIIKDLGAGQHGKVKLAKDLKTGINVAIKIVDRTNKGNSIARLTKKSQSQEDKIRKEIAIMKKCRHPHVVRLLEVLDAENSRKIYMVLEYLEKGEIKWQQLPENLSGIQEPLLSINETKHTFRDVVCGLEYLHHQNIIHRDIKPSNLLVDKHGNVKISDFGVSFAASLNGENEFELAKTAGTPAFLAPELCQIHSSANIKVTHKIDIWALGITLYCLLFGRLPFTAESEFKLFDVINNSELKFPDMSQWIDAEKLSSNDLKQSTDLLNKLLEKNPEKRIDIDEIKLHPFYLEDLTNEEKNHYDEACWKIGMKIDVSNKEMDEAVVGIGGLIKKKFIDMKKAWSTNSTSTSNSTSIPTPTSQTTIEKSLKPSGLSSMSLKDSHSYIFSEVAQNSSDVLPTDMSASPVKSDTHTITQPAEFLVPPELLEQVSLDEQLSDFSDMGNESPRPLDLQQHEFSITNDLAEIPSDNNNNKTTANNNNDTIELKHDDADDNDEDIYDFRKELAKSELRSNLTVNPSYASLDSYYDEGYNKFFSNAPSGLGSFSNRNQIYTNNNNNNNTSSSSNFTNSVSMLRNLPKQNQKASPSKQSNISLSTSSSKRGGFYIPQREMSSPDSSSPQMRPVSPLVNQRGILPNRATGYGTQRKQIQRQIQHSSDDDDDDDNDEPFMINKKSLASRRYSARKREIPIEKDNDSDDNPITITASRSPIKFENIPRTAIYGTKINLLRSQSGDAYNETESDNSDSDSYSDDELMLNFTRSNVEGRSSSINEPIRKSILSNKIKTSQVVDVPDNIIQNDNIVNSAGQNGKHNPMYDKVLNDIAIISINDEPIDQ